MTAEEKGISLERGSPSSSDEVFLGHCTLCWLSSELPQKPSCWKQSYLLGKVTFAQVDDQVGNKILPRCPEDQEGKKEQHGGLVLLSSLPASFDVHINTIFMKGDIGTCA